MDKWWKVSLEEEFKKNPQLAESNINDMRTWLESQVHLPNVDDLTLVMFLHAADYNLEYAKSLFETNYSYRTNANIFKTRDPLSTEIQSATKVGRSGILIDENTKDLILVGDIRHSDVSQYSPIGHGTVTFMLTDVAQLKYGTVPGLILAVDTNNFTLTHLLKISMTILRTVVPYCQDVNTMTCKAIHVINEGALIEKLMMMVMPLLNERMRKRIFFHKTPEELKHHIPPTAIPKDWGGLAPCMDDIAADSVKLLEDHRDYFADEAKLRIDLSKKPKQSGFLRNYFSFI